MRLHRLILTVTTFGLPLTAYQQSSDSPLKIGGAYAVQLECEQNHQNASENARIGDVQSAAEWAAKAAKARNRGLSLDFEIADEFVALTRFCVENGREGDATSYADLAMIGVRNIEARGTRMERLQAALLEGELFEKVYHLPDAADAAYSKALSIDPANLSALEGRGRLHLFETQTELRAAEQLKIRNERNGAR